MEENNKVIIILGTTAAGKTKIAVRLAKRFNGEIISADSRQVYRGMDVGSGKDLKEYAGVRYHLIDCASPKRDFSVARWQMMANQEIKNILKRGKVPVICGGTGLYISAITEGYLLPPAGNNKIIRSRLSKKTLDELLRELKRVDFKTYAHIDRHNRRRVQRALEIYYQTGKPKSALVGKSKPNFDFLKIGVAFPQEVLVKRISKRLRTRLEKEAMIQEVKKLRQSGVSWKRLEAFGLEYRFIARYLQGKTTYQEMYESLEKAIKDFSKRQMTWFKRDKSVIWENDYSKIVILVNNFLK
ncbi:MAG: tRNA (adenosine(37)-N6)-dimethylallyltransferase MiaA [Candidatus Buchananbacteria bacterium]|nr:tRNA (adenosine(37)-N6)-dimethylallyltransferase MiaA [Candidatus Buchananbacteria bacterium]